jgi:hypothetical protein
LQQLLAVFSIFLPEQQLFPSLLSQHADAVLSFAQLSLPQPSLQQEAAVLWLLSFMQDIAPLAVAFLPPQHEVCSLLSIDFMS